MPQRTYSQEEVDAILERALRAEAKDGTRLTHDELVAAAAEVGIPKDAIDAAAREDEALVSDKQLLATWKRRARMAVVRHFVTYALVSAMLAFINFMTGAHFLWFPIVMLGWGIGIAMHFINTFFADEERVLERERRRADRRARRARWKRRGREFERAVDQGVRALIEMANQKGGPRIEVPPNQVRIDARDGVDEEHEREGDERKITR